MEHEINCLDYRYVYGNDHLSVNVTGVETSSGNIVENGNQIRLYYHMDYLGTADYLTSPVSLKVTSWTHYNEWGEITHNAVLKCGMRELDMVKRYATHDYDAVLNMFYAKARFYDADNRRFASVDPILEPSGYDIAAYVDEPVQLVQYLYVKNTPLTSIDPDGLRYKPLQDLVNAYGAQLEWLVKDEGDKKDIVYGAKVTLNGYQATYTATCYDYDNAFLQEMLDQKPTKNGAGIDWIMYVDDLTFGHQWNHIYNAPIEEANKDTIYDANGYINGQRLDVIKDLKYGVTVMDGVGCELIAIYNALNKLGYKDSISEIAYYYEKNPGMRLGGIWGTIPVNIPDYFKKYSCIAVEKIDLSQIDEELNLDNAVIITFMNPNFLKYGIHTIMLERLPDGRINAYNFSGKDDTPTPFDSVYTMLGRQREFIIAYVVSNDSCSTS